MMSAMPSFAHTVQVAASPEAVYAIIDDTDRTPEWLRRCTKIDNPANGHNTVGTPLTYHYTVSYTHLTLPTNSRV